MSSIIERLSEGVVNRDMRAEGSALLSKWERTGLLEGLDGDRQKNSMARLLENQAKELLRESSALRSGDVEGFAAVAFPIVRRVFAGLIANDLVSVQPMSLPSGLIFFLDFLYSAEQGASGAAAAARMGNTKNKSIYGTDRVGSEVTAGVNLVGSTLKEDLGGPRTTSGYSYASPTGSNAALAAAVTDVALKDCFTLDGSITDARQKMIEYDADLLASTDSSINVYVLDVAKTNAAGNTVFDQGDFENMGAWTLNDIPEASTSGNDLQSLLNGVTGVASIAIATTAQVRRLTRSITTTESATSTAGGAVRFVLTDSAATITEGSSGASTATLDAGKIVFPITDDFTTGTGTGAVVATTVWGLEGTDGIPEIDIKVDSIAITAQTKKLKAKWTPELGQDLNAYHNLDAEVELTSILSEQIALEIDREILADLVNGATAATYYWSRSPGLFVNKETGAELGASSAAPDFTGTVSEWYETLVETINDVSAQIHRKTLRGGANFLVCGPDVANVLEFTAGFRASVTHDSETGSVGAVNVGSLSKKFDVIVDPYFLRNVVLVGRRGSSFLESGYVYAPYVPLQTTPTIFGPDDFVPRKGVMTRYAKKMVRPDMYGLVICRGILGEEGTS
jgi:hypothetical protein